MNKNQILINKFLKAKEWENYVPKKLFKYRKFDEYTFDMLENLYFYLCPAKDLDDETECDTSVAVNDFIDIYNNNLTGKTINYLLQLIKPYTSEENYYMAVDLINSIRNRDGSIRAHLMLDINEELKQLLPNVDIIQITNIMVQLPSYLKNPDIKKKLNDEVMFLLNAKQNTGVCSLATSSNNDEMWEKYCLDYSGYCIEIDISALNNLDDLFPVIYVDKENRNKDITIGLMADIINALILAISGGQAHPDISNCFQLLLTKDKKWEYQDEWRILGNPGEHYPISKISKIYIGHNANVKDKDVLIKFCKEHNIDYRVK